MTVTQPWKLSTVSSPGEHPLPHSPDYLYPVANPSLLSGEPLLINMWKWFQVIVVENPRIQMSVVKYLCIDFPASSEVYM